MNIPDSDGKITQQSSRANYTAPSPISTAALSDNDVSDVADALNFLLTELDTPKPVRLLLQALLGLLAGRKTVVEFFHFDLARRLYYLPFIPNREEFKKLKASHEGKVQSAIQKMLDWRNGWKNLPIEYKPGGKTEEGELYPSKIQTPLLSWAAELVDSVRAVEDFETLPRDARANIFRDSAQSLLKKKRVTSIEPAQKPEPRQQTEGQIYGTLISAARRHTAKVLAQTQLSPDEVIVRILRDLATRLEAEFSEKGVENTPLPQPETRENFQPLSSGMGVEFSASLSLTPLPHELSAVEAFASVGGELEKVIVLDDTKPTDKQAVASRETDFAQFLEDLPSLKERAERDHFSIVGRVRGPVLQIDDCDQDTTCLLQQFAFATFETSPKNFQCWLAFKDDDDKEAAASRIIAGLKIILPDTQANKGSGGAIRWPGTTNYKPIRRQADGSYPVVTMGQVQLGRTVTPSELDDAGLLAPEERQPRLGGETQTRASGDVKPYSHYLGKVELKANGKPDRSKADMAFVNACFRARMAKETIEKLLMKSSERAKEKGWSDVRRTVASGERYMWGLQ